MHLSIARTSLPVIALTIGSFCSAAEMTISGTPTLHVRVGERYYFLPIVKNADLTRLEFNYVNKPAWSKSYRRSGLIMGTPSAPGIYPDVQIGAWDGAQYTELAPFTITVTSASGGQAAQGVAHQTWATPLFNTDGSRLTDLAGYSIRYGNNENELQHHITVMPAEATSLEVDHLSAGTWYFKIASVNQAGIMGPYSALADSSVP